MAKCRAKNPGACSDPRCPERRALQHLLVAAVRNGDFEAYMSAKEAEKRLKPSYIYPAYSISEYDKLIVEDTGKPGTYYRAAIPPNERATYVWDTSVVKDYATFEDIEEDYRKDKNIRLFLKEISGAGYFPSPPVEPLAGFSVADFHVSPALRGQGAGNHIMRTLTKHADDNGLVMHLVPTEAGDGKLDSDHPEYKIRALAHQKRLISFYERHGFIKNPFFRSMNRTDYLTGEPNEPDLSEQAKYTRKAGKILTQHSQYIRYPNRKMPKGFLKRVKKET